MLGECYERGLGIRANPKKAFLYYKQAYDLDPAKSYLQYMMGACYCDGIGVKKDYDLAMKYLTSICKEMDSAKILLAKCYLFGKKDAYTCALLCSQITTEAFRDEDNDLMDLAMDHLSDDQTVKILETIELKETGTNEGQSKGTASKAVKNTSSANDSLSFNYGRSGVNISINTSYAKK